MDLESQLRKLFPDHEPEAEPGSGSTTASGSSDEKPLWMQEEPIRCIYEKRRGKPHTILEGYTGAEADFAHLTRWLKKELSVGGSFKGDCIIIQGDYRDRIMQLLKDKGFNVKRVGG